MNTLQTLAFEQLTVRILDRGGVPWFVAADVCRVLDVDTTQTRRLDEDEKGLCSIQTHGGQQDMVCVNESGLYSLVLGSRKPEAKAFKRWITHEVLPAIRRDGFYGAPLTPALPTDYLSALKALVDAEETKVAQAKQLALGPNKLFAWLRDEKILIGAGAKKNLPMQAYLDRGYFEVREYSITHKQSGIENKAQTLVTPKGMAWIHARWQAAHPTAVAQRKEG